MNGRRVIFELKIVGWFLWLSTKQIYIGKPFSTRSMATFMFMTAWAFEARHCPTLLNEIKKTKLDSNTEPQAGINILLCTVPRLHYSLTTRMPRLWMCVGFVRPWHWCGFGGLNYFSLFSVTKHNSLFE
jgi:hypothetical protein